MSSAFNIARLRRKTEYSCRLSFRISRLNADLDRLNTILNVRGLPPRLVTNLLYILVKCITNLFNLFRRELADLAVKVNVCGGDLLRPAEGV